MNLVPDKQIIIIFPFLTTKYRKTELCVDNKVQETIGDVYCPTCRNEKCVYISTNETTSKMCKACCHVLNIPFEDQKSTIMFFGVNGTHCFARNRVVTTKKTIYIFQEVSPPITIKHTRNQAKKGQIYSIDGIIVSTPHWLTQLTKNSFPISFQTLSIYSKAKWSSQRPTMYWMVSQLWTRFSYSDRKRSGPRDDNKLPGFYSGSLELVVVSKTRIFE